MFDRVVVEVIEMARIIPFVAQGMFPKAPLPHAPPTSGLTGGSERFFCTAAREPGLGEVFFDGAQRLE